MEYIVSLLMLMLVGCGRPRLSIIKPSPIIPIITTPERTAVPLLVDPCGDSTRNDELLYQLEDGSLVELVSLGYRDRVVIFKDGVYTTTDGDNCVFEVKNGKIVKESHHY